MAATAASGKHLYQAMANMGFWLAVASAIAIGLEIQDHTSLVHGAFADELYAEGTTDAQREAIVSHLKHVKETRKVMIYVLTTTLLAGLAICIAGCCFWYRKIQSYEDNSRAKGLATKLPGDE